MFGSFDISTSALSAQRTRIDTIASNIANINTTMDPNGRPSPYRRLATVFEAQRTPEGGMGVRVSKITQDQGNFRIKNEPWHPAADANGNVRYPNVDLSTELVNAIEATRAYEANVTAIETTKSMVNANLRLLA